MTAPDYTPLPREQLQQTLRIGPPTNDQRSKGYALVNVLESERFEDEHIPGSINIPQSQIDEFGRRYDKDKRIILYCASPECPASTQVAERLTERGFEHVFDYAGGMSDWKSAGNEVVGESA